MLDRIIDDLERIVKDFYFESHLGFKYIPIQFINRLIAKYKCPHGTIGGRVSCMACRPELIKGRE